MNVFAPPLLQFYVSYVGLEVALRACLLGQQQQQDVQAEFR